MVREMTQMNVRLEHGDRTRLDTVADRLGITSPELIRALVRRDLDSLERRPEVLEAAILATLRSRLRSRTKAA